MLIGLFSFIYKTVLKLLILKINMNKLYKKILCWRWSLWISIATLSRKLLILILILLERENIVKFLLS